MEANAGEYIKNYLHLKTFPRISLHCRPAAIQYWEYEYDILLVHGKEKSTLFPTYFVVPVKSSRKTSNTNTRDIFSFPVHVLGNSLSTVDIRSIDTFKFTLWKLCRLMNDSEWCILCLKGMVRKNLVSFATVFQDVTQLSPGVCSLIDHRREPIRMRE